MALRKSKVLRKINQPKWHGPHTRLNLQKGEIKEQKKQCLRSWKERLHSLPAVRAALVLQSPKVWPRMERPSSSRTQRTATRLPPSHRNLNSRPAKSANPLRQNQREPK